MSFIDKFYKKNNNILVKGGRKSTKNLKIKSFNEYSTRRNELDYTTTHLSAYTKFGCVSIREVYHKMKKNLNQKINYLINCFERIMLIFLNIFHMFWKEKV